LTFSPCAHMVGEMRQYRKPDPRWNWRAYLTAEERSMLAAADKAKAEWQRLNVQRAAIQNRAIQRAKYNAKREKRR
jgi:hypothetical protein